MVQELGSLGLCGLIVDLLAFPAALYEACALKLLKVMGKGRGAHIHHGREVDDTFLTVAEYPEEADTASVTELLKYICHGLETFGLRHVVEAVLKALSVVVGQMFFCHIILSHL